MTQLTLRALKAKHGDCLFIFAGGTTVLVDGGPSGVYNQTLRGHLQNLPSNGGNPPRIHLLMVSHIDADHIDGVLDLTDELIEAQDDEQDPIVRIDRAWHNSFSDVIAKQKIETPNENKANAASLADALEKLTTPTFNPHDAKLVLSSVGQGRRLRRDLSTLNIDLNKRFKDKIVMQGATSSPWKRGDLTIDVIGPTQAELDDLKKAWKKQLEKILQDEGEASVAAAGGLDRSVSNLASIVAIAEAGDKRILLTGDARGDKILNWLENTGQLDADGRVHFDVLKIAHHGSTNNVSLDFFKRVTADHYVVSGNGGHGNPEPDMLEMIFSARPNLDYKIHMTYGPEELKQHKSFKKAGNNSKLDLVLSDSKRLSVLNYPGVDVDYVDITV